MNKATRLRLKNIVDGKLREVVHSLKDAFSNGSHEEEARMLFIQLAYYVTTFKGQVDTSELDDAFELSQVCCGALQVEKMSADVDFITALYHFTNFLVQKERIEDVLILLKYTLVAAQNYKHNNSLLENIYLNMHLLFLGVSKSLEIKKFNESGTEGNSKMWFNVLECALLILAYVNRSLLQQLFSYLAKYSHTCKENVVTTKSFHLKIFHAIRDHTESDVKISDVKPVYQQFCFMAAGLLKSYLVANDVKAAADVLAAAFNSLRTFIEEQSAYMQCLVVFSEIISLLVSDDLQAMTSRLKSCNNCIRRLINTGGETNDTASSIMFTSACRVALDVQSHLWDGMSANRWNRVLDVATQTQLYYLFLSMSQELGRKKDDPLNVRLSVCLDNMVLHCVYKSACYETDSFEMLVPQVISVLNKCVDSLVGMKGGDSFWAAIWKAVAVNCYKLASICLKLDMYSLVKELIIPLYQGMMLLEECVEPICFKDSFYLTVAILVKAYLGMKKSRRALLACALGIVSTPELQSRIFMLWADVKKKNVDDDNIQAITVQEVLTTQKSKISAMNPNVNFQGLNYCELTVMELEAYHNTNVYLPKSIEAAYCTVPVSQCVLHTRALYVNLNCMWQSQDVELCDKAIALCGDAIYCLKNTNKNFPDSEKQLRLFLLAQMNFCLFLHNFKKTHAKQKEEVEAIRVFPAKRTFEMGSIPDPNDTCDEIPAYVNLTVAKEQVVLHYLDEAASFWTEALAYEAAPHKDINIAAQFRDLEAAASIYYVYGLQAHGLRVWGLYYKLGLCAGDRLACLTALCHIMEVVVCRNDHAKLKEMESIVEELDMNSNSSSSKDVNLLFLYYISRSENCYTNKMYEEGVHFLKKLPELSKYVDTLLYVRYKILTAKYLLSWPEVVTPDKLGELSVLFAMRIAFDYIQSYATSYPSETGNVCTYYQMLYILFETSLFCGRQFLQLCWPREARCFLKEHLILAQKLALATRTVEFLSILAQVDVLCGAVNDAEVKVRGMKYILSLQTVCLQEMFSPPKDELDDDDCLAAQFGLLTLNLGNEEEIWMDSAYTDSMGGSPILRKAPFSLPKFVSHNECCNCMWCTNLTAQHLTLVVTTLEAVLYYYHDDKKTALSFFKGGLRLAEKLTVKQTKFLKMSSEWLLFQEKVCDSLILPSCKCFEVSKIKLILHFCDLLCSQRLFGMARKFNEHAFMLLDSVKDQNLWCEVLKQQMDIAIVAERDIAKQKNDLKGEIIEKSDEEEISPTSCSFKTPMRKVECKAQPSRFHVARKMPAVESKIGSAKRTGSVFGVWTPGVEELEDDVFSCDSKTATAATSSSRTLRKCTLTTSYGTRMKSARKPSHRMITSSSSSPEDGKSMKGLNATRSCGKKLTRLNDKNNHPLDKTKENVFVYVDASENCYKMPKQDKASTRRIVKTESAVNKQNKVLPVPENLYAVLPGEVVQTALQSAVIVGGRQTRKKVLKKCPFILD